MEPPPDPDASDPDDAAGIIAFGDYRLDLVNRELHGGAGRIELGSRYFDALALLAREPGRLVSKDRFMAEVWRGIPVTDEALTQCIRSLRRALGDEAAAPRFIETVPKHGYRFVALRAPSALPEAPSAGQAGPSRSGRLAGTGAIGGGAAGAIGGLIYGFAATTGGAATVPVLTALGGALGVVGGAAVGGGMALARQLSGRRGWAEIAGAAAGGLAIGAIGQTLSRDGVAVLTGAALGPITGMAEGVLLGLAVGVATAVSPLLASRWRAVAAAAVPGALAGLAIALIGGRLFGASLFELQAHLPGSGLALERIGAALGETGFGPLARAVTSAFEGAAFAAGVIFAERLLPRR